MVLCEEKAEKHTLKKRKSGKEKRHGRRIKYERRRTQSLLPLFFSSFPPKLYQLAERSVKKFLIYLRMEEGKSRPGSAIRVLLSMKRQKQLRHRLSRGPFCAAFILYHRFFTDYLRNVSGLESIFRTLLLFRCTQATEGQFIHKFIYIIPEAGLSLKHTSLGSARSKTLWPLFPCLEEGEEEKFYFSGDTDFIR